MTKKKIRLRYFDPKTIWGQGREKTAKIIAKYQRSQGCPAKVSLAPNGETWCVESKTVPWTERFAFNEAHDCPYGTYLLEPYDEYKLLVCKPL